MSLVFGTRNENVCAARLTKVELKGDAASVQWVGQLFHPEMLPTQELFRSIPCPYYVAGLCERPHCFFRHTKSDILLARKVDQAQLLGVGGSSDDEDEGRPQSKSNGSSNQIEKLKSSSNKISETSSVVTPSPSLRFDELRKRSAVDKLEGANKIIRLSLEDFAEIKDTNSQENEKDPQHQKSPSIDSKAGIKLNEALKEVDKSNKQDSPPLNKSHQTEQAGNSHSKNRSSSSSSSSANSSKHKDAKKTSKTNDKKSSSRHSSDSKERSHKSSSSSHSHSSKSSSNNSKSSSSRSSSSSKSKDHKKERGRDRKDSNKASSKNSSTPNSNKTDNCKSDSDIEILDDLEYPDSYGNAEEFKLPEVSDYEDDPDDIALECLKMFEDYKPEVQEEIGENNNTIEDLSLKFANTSSSVSISPLSKRRLAHAAAVNLPPTLPKSKTSVPPRSKHDLMNTIGSRLESQRRNLSEEGTPLTPPSSVSNKKRIAHVPNVSGLLKPSSTVGSNFASESASSNGRLTQPTDIGVTMHANKQVGTVAQTAIKGQARLAHQPSTPVVHAKRPILVLDSPTKISKIPNNVRQRILDQIYDTCAKIYAGKPELAFSTAINEENTLALRCFSKTVYLSLSVTVVTRLRRELQTMSFQAANGNGSAPFIAGTANPIVSHDKNLVGSAAHNCSIKTSREKTFPKDNELYKALTTYLMSEAELRDNGFPRPHPSGDAGRAVAKSRYNEEPFVYEETRRTCERCRKVYCVDLDGNQIRSELCVFHERRKTRKKVGRSLITSYECCGAETGAEGCNSFQFHIPKSIQVDRCRGFVSCVKDAGEDTTMGMNQWDIVAIDCEMVATTAGSELARATFIGRDQEILYDKLVVPSHTVIDYLTKYSGLTEADLKNATATLTDVQAAMLTQLRPNSILIGHSLESDLLALRFKHDCVIDTSVIFPHRMGLPYKRALRNLTSEYLSQIIQNSEAGHDSTEDARAALSLVYHKLSEDLKKKSTVVES